MLDYFDPSPAKDPLRGSPQSQELLNKGILSEEELRFGHNFAWIINWLVLPYGIPSTRYSEKKDNDEEQYTFALQICKEGTTL